MGAYFNPGSENLERNVNSRIFVDKSLVMTVLNGFFNTDDGFLCVSRPRRFGKTVVGNLISAFYSRGSDARPIFEKLKIAQTREWDKRLNKCNVIHIDLGAFYSQYKECGDVIGKLNEIVVDEMRQELLDIQIRQGDPLSEAIIQAYEKTGIPFVFIIDEYDVMVRENVGQAEFERYLSMLNGIFKSVTCGRAIALAYLTGIIPIVRDKVQSKLNNFTEYTMLKPMELAPYIGFTNDEVKELCEKYNMNFDECLRWYDGYHIAPGVSVCNSNSVCRAMKSHEFDDYWTQTGAYTAVSDYVTLNFEGLRDDVTAMMGGQSVPVDTGSFLNTLTDFRNRDDVLTYLIHLGYLAYDAPTKKCHIPNGEIRQEWVRALNVAPAYAPVMKIVKASRQLLADTLACDEDAVAAGLDKAHEEATSPLTYNNEGSLQSAIGLAYFFATSEYSIIKEFPAGKGYADLALIPFVKGRPAIVIELKMKGGVDAAMQQIIDRHYADALAPFSGNTLRVAVSYDKKTKAHSCKICKE
ncbi:MAG: AAA family ATPase [Bacteroidales bacterium]|nr:AAA family ATPase [Bacteroidales bacterium]MDY4174975.1 AAA family ATPase [Bacteroidales bacterium]